jgi:S1/P1 nuclease
VIPAAALAWDAAGHETVAAIADQLIAGRRAQAEARKLLNSGDSLQSVSTWADCAREHCTRLAPEDRRFERRNPHQAHYHYTDIPFQAAAYEEGGVGASEDDIVHISKQCIAVLKGAHGAAANPHEFSARDALLLLVHLVADLHQPLHIGVAYINDENEFVVPASVAALEHSGIFRSAGDNDLIFASRSLHYFWDHDAVSEAMQRANAHTPAEFAGILIRNAPDLPIVTGDVTKWPAKWATETLGVSKEAHRGVRIEEREARARDAHPAWRVVAPAQYRSEAAAITSVELTRAGYRLAAVLQAIWH